MSSTAIVVRQLGEQLEINRTHSRLAVGILLFQDLAFAPFLALATSLAAAEDILSPTWLLGMVGRAIVALLLVLFVGRRLLRPLFGEIARHRSSETFTLTVLFVALGSAWATNALGLSLALGGFLAGMLLAETEFRHQTEAVIKPFQDILLGLFFVSVGMLLDLRLLLGQLPLVLLLLVALLVTKALIILLIARQFVPNTRKALRTGIVVCMGGEFGFALLTLLLKGRVIDPGIVQALLTTVALSMVLGPLIVRYNSRIADLILRRPTRSGFGSCARDGGDPRTGKPRARDHLRFRAGRAEPGACAGKARLRVHRTRSRPVPDPRCAPGGRPGGLW